VAGHFPNARIVADRFHVIRIIIIISRPVGVRSMEGCQKPRPDLFDAASSAQSSTRSAAPTGGIFGIASVLDTIYRFKQRLCYLLLKKHRTRKQCEQLIPRFLRAVYQLR